MKKCPNCGENNEDNVLVCKKCRQTLLNQGDTPKRYVPIPAPASTPSPRNKSKSDAPTLSFPAKRSFRSLDATISILKSLGAITIIAGLIGGIFTGVILGELDIVVGFFAGFGVFLIFLIAAIQLLARVDVLSALIAIQENTYITAVNTYCLGLAQGNNTGEK
jgi:hypothetical protein